MRLPIMEEATESEAGQWSGTFNVTFLRAGFGDSDGGCEFSHRASSGCQDPQKSRLGSTASQR